MGGTVPLSYEVKDRKLEINTPEARRVNQIFETYLELGSVAKLRQELFQLGIHPRAKNASVSKRFSCGALYTLLQNPIYMGKIRHKEQTYNGLHEPVIEQGLWDRVQQRISFNRVVRKSGSNANSPSLLAGLIVDQNGRRLTPSHANKKGHRYRYYISKPNMGGMTTKVAHEKLSIPAAEPERLVCDRVIQFLRDDGEIADAIAEYALSASELENTITAARICADSFHELGMLGQRQLLTIMIQSIQILPERIEIIMDPSSLLEATDTNKHGADAKPAQPEKLVTLSIKASLQRCGIEKRLVIGGRSQNESNQPDKALLQLLSRAYCYKDMLLTSNDGSVSKLAEQVGVTSSYFSRIVRLGFLAPNIVSAFMNGKQPATLTARQLAHDTNLAIDWNDQREQLGIGNSK
ncbi:MAG: recombinase family protein [Hyphomicrobiales bacterium]